MRRSYTLQVVIDGVPVEVGTLYVHEDGNTHAELHDAFIEVVPDRSGYMLRKYQEAVKTTKDRNE